MPLVAVLATGGAAGLLAAWLALPYLNRQLDAIVIPITPLPVSSGKYNVTRTSRELPLILDRAGAPQRVAVDFWFPVDKAGDPSREPWPLIIYAPGWDGSREDNALLAGELASHGYVIAALDDIGIDAKALQSRGTDIDAAATAGVDFSSPESVERTNKVAEQRVHLMVAKMQRLLDALAIGPGKDGGLALDGRVDLERVGVLGFSIGGSAAAEATLFDPRFKAAVNMDGWLVGRALEKRLTVPFLTYNSDVPQLQEWAKSRDLAKRTSAFLTERDRALQLEQSRSAASHMLFFRDVDHADFTDSLFAPTLKGYLKRWLRTAGDRRRLWQYIGAYQLAFFERYLRSQTIHSPLLDDPISNPQVTRLGETRK